MPLYEHELAPWERKNEYFNNIKLGQSVRTQIELLSTSTKAMIATQMASTNAIIASQDRISEGIDNLSYGIDAVAKGIQGLQAAFEWGISEVVWQIEQNREVFKDILEVLSAPLDTQAKELRKRAEEAYTNGWFDDSLEVFLESEKKNIHDFSIHISIGMIYLFHNINKEKALEYFDKAINYAKPKSNYHASLALMHKALIKRDYGLFEEAAKYSAEAVSLSPDLSEALYQYSQYHAILNKLDMAIPFLKKIIKMDVNYCEKINNEKDFDKVRFQVNTMFEEVRNSEGEIARKNYSSLIKSIEYFSRSLNDLKAVEPILIQDDKLKKNLGRVEILLQRNSYRDYLEANPLLNTCSFIFNNLRKEAKSQLEIKINRYKLQIKRIEDKNTQQNMQRRSKAKSWISNIGIALFILLGVGMGVRSCSYRMFHENPNHSVGDAMGNLFIPFIYVIGIGAIGYVITYLIKSFAVSNIKQELLSVPVEILELESKITRIKNVIVTIASP